MNDVAPEFHAVGCQIILVSADSHFTHFAWMNIPRQKGGVGSLQIPLLSDLNKKIGKEYGVFCAEQDRHLR